MDCLQCDRPALERGEVYKGIVIRECDAGHRTGLINITDQVAEDENLEGAA
ncbi:hypothetical protein LCGC14_1422990 [marine sediment metagenome]|uniref:Uncharacterized protein n=1 Tax=marine sediment metagenome TaxID=412755 RepID=A0A0F9MSI5_9ZZZZ